MAIGEKPKQVLLCMTLQHLFRSAELTNLIKKFNPSENYSFSLELESALAKVLQESSKIPPHHIIKNPSLPSVFHSDLDNFDQNTASGSVHTSHRIMLQEVGPLLETPDVEAVGDIEIDDMDTTLITQCSKIWGRFHKASLR